MSGIIGYLGNKKALPVLLKGLERFEFKGYDSIGLTTLDGDQFTTVKFAGKLTALHPILKAEEHHGIIGLAHSRWATHGQANEVNAHPHFSNSKNLAIVHKGIVENYAGLKEKLKSEGYHFESDTDTEILVNWIEYIFETQDVDMHKAIQIALNQVIGTYAIILIDKKAGNLYAVRKGAQLVIGVSENEYYASTNTAPLASYTDKVIYMEEKDVYRFDVEKGISILNLDNIQKTHIIEALTEDLELIEKEGYDHFMLKEIYQQPQTVRDAYRGRMDVNGPWVRLGGVNEYINRLSKAGRFVFGSCGTSWHASLVAEYLLEELARIPVEVEYASEYRYRNPIFKEDDVFVAISQSGETADTIAAIHLAKDNGALIYGICNVVGSTISKMSHAGSYTHAGQEIGIASTKGFTNQLVVLTLMALQLAYNNGKISTSRLIEILSELEEIPNKMEEILRLDQHIKAIAQDYHHATNFLFLGRGANYPIALEGALKLKEISYIHAEGYPAAEMKHGPIALIDENMPVVVLATNNSAYEKIVSNIQEVIARKGKVIAIVNEGDTEIKKIANHVIEIPNTLELFSPLLSVVPLQLLAYHIAVLRGADVDAPRNLTKSVTVE